MTLLRLTPDGERLRRVAKAHAAGELSTPDYRRIRSDVIESYIRGGGEDVTGDDTQQRWLERPLRLPPIAAGIQDTPVGSGADLRGAAATLLRPYAGWIAVGIVILVIVIVAVVR